MKKRFTLVCLAVLATVSFGASDRRGDTFSIGNGRVPDFSKYKVLKSSLKHHAREVRSDYTTIPGSVVHWYSDGHAKTNVIRHLDMMVQTNAYEQVLIRTDAEAEPTRKIRNAKKNAEKKDQKNLEKAIKDMEKARDKSSESMYDLYQSILDVLNEASES